MAVVTISRIQVRRGKKNEGSGLPQLSSGEFGWAVDSQELYIGNGSVSEGSPAVGNTKLLSEHDNLFEFANTYSYKKNLNIQTGSNPNSPVLRTLQDRLDDKVSIRAFGASGDGTDQTAELQRALDQLYLNASNKGQPTSRVELYLEAGEYQITSTIYIPPFATIRGAGQEKTFILSGAGYPAFMTVNDQALPGNYPGDENSSTLTQARHIEVSGLTIRSEQGPGIVLRSCKDSIFKDITLQGSFEFGDTVDGESDALRMTSLSTAVTCQNNTFENIVIKNWVTAVKTDHDITNNIWDNCLVTHVWQGFAFGATTVLGTPGMLTGPKNNIISNSTFKDIYIKAIYIAAGEENKSIDNKFYQVGNEGGTSLNNVHPIIEFTSASNSSRGDWFERTEELGHDQTFISGVVYNPEVKGPVITEFDHTNSVNVGQSGTPTKLFRLPADTAKGYEIDYIYKSSAVNATRSGTLTIVVDPSNDFVTLTDEYDFAGDSQYDENIEFSAQNYDEDLDLSVDTVAVMMLNSTNSDDAVMYYKIKTKS